MKRLLLTLIALMVLFLAVGTVNAATPGEEQTVTQEWYLVTGEQEGLQYCLVCETDREFVDPILEEDWYLTDDTSFVEKEVTAKMMQKGPKPTLEGEIFNDGWYLK